MSRAARVAEVLASEPDGISLDDLCGRLGPDHPRALVSAALAHLKKRGKADRVGPGVWRSSAGNAATPASSSSEGGGGASPSPTVLPPLPLRPGGRRTLPSRHVFQPVDYDRGCGMCGRKPDVHRVPA